MLQLCSIKDVKSGNFNDPQAFRHKVEAMRAVANSATNPESSLFTYPHDFELWLVGQFNPLTGELIPAMELISTVLDLKELANVKA